MKGKNWALSLAVIVGLVLGACGGSAPSDDPPPAAPPLDAPPETVEAGPAEVDAAPGNTVFVISPQETEARFIVDEILNDTLNTVIGVTNAVEGQIAADLQNTANSQVGVIRIDLSTLTTDNSFRNRALSTFILGSSDPAFQFAEFSPTQIRGLEGPAVIGQTYPVEITGDLTVKGVTTPITFAGTVTLTSETRLEGTAATTVRYEDLGVTIPRLPPQVASVDESMILEIDLVAFAG